MMIKLIHKQAVELWVSIKLDDNTINPSFYILNKLTGYTEHPVIVPTDIVELCEQINEIKGFAELTEKEQFDIQQLGVNLFLDGQSLVKKNTKVSVVFRRINTIGYILAVVSIAVAGISWFVVGFAAGNWLAYGAAKTAKQRNDPRAPAWEMPVHIAIHLVTLVGMLGFSIYNLLMHYR